jgi:serine protease AprX
MRVERDWLRNLIFSADETRRFTQDSPIMPDVWLVAGMFYCRDPKARVDLLATPFKNHSPSELAAELRVCISHRSNTRESDSFRGVYEAEELIWADGRPARRVELRSTPSLAVNQTNVAVSLTLEELIACALPLTAWWQRNIVAKEDRKNPDSELEVQAAKPERDWLQRVVGVIVLCSQTRTDPDADFARDEDAPAYLSADQAGLLRRATREDSRRFAAMMLDREGQAREFNRLIHSVKAVQRSPLLWRLNLNRSAFPAISRSVPTTKADAARRVFRIQCSQLCWAILDSGIDRSHPALTDESSNSRVLRAYDFTRLRALLSLDSHQTTGPASVHRGGDTEVRDRQTKRVRQNLRAGRMLDWGALLPLITISPQEADRRVLLDHGTHVAGILGAREVVASQGEGMCPDIGLCDIRVLDSHGSGDEFSIIAALQFIRYLNANSDRQVIHGVNISLSLLHDVENYACGRTPICEECERLVNSGVVVVAAAGNLGYERVLTPGGEIQAYRSISITDPGNGDAVITVGSTHRFEPHTYGTSYFSSRGPTGDGRAKPDVLAPGEKIVSTLPGGDYGPKDGTSMAAPHVSGVAALLMARYSEFVGRPAEIKDIIRRSATNLGREPYFQGSGLVDALRALQKV